MIPTVTEECIATLILQEGRDTLEYLKESIDLLELRQPVLKKILFNDLDKVLTLSLSGEDTPELSELKLKGIVALIIRCMYSQDEANELSAQWSNNV